MEISIEAFSFWGQYVSYDFKAIKAYFRKAKGTPWRMQDPYHGFNQEIV